MERLYAVKSDLSSIHTGLSGVYILLNLLLYSRTGRIVLTKKRFRRYLDKSLRSVGSRINNYMTKSIFDLLCNNAEYCEYGGRISKVAVRIDRSRGVRIVLAILSSALLDVYRTLEAPVYRYISTIGLALCGLCF